MEARSERSRDRRDRTKRPEEPRPTVEGTVGIWVNKRALSFLDIPMRHKLVGEAAGWRLEVIEDGKLLLHGDAGKRGIDVESGDFVLSAGDDIYVGLHRSIGEQAASRGDSASEEK